MCQRTSTCSLRSTTTAVLAIAVLLSGATTSQKCESKSWGMLSYRSQTICTGVIDEFPEIKQLSQSLSCLNCNVQILHKDSVPNFRGDVFNVSYSHVRTIRKDAFATFWPTVKRFKLNNNEISYLETGLFHNFTGLAELNLSSNNLTSLLPSQFEGVSADNLDLSQNQIQDITDVFNSLSVSTLNISFNRIEKIPVGVFADMTVKKNSIAGFFMQERSLYLSSNGIKEISQGSFKVRGDFDNIYLMNNYISTIKNDTFADLKLRSLHLTNNRITTLEERAFAGLSTMRVLVLCNNYIDHLPLGVFSTLRSLETLKMDSNHITQIGPTAFSGMPVLKVLNMSRNYLETLTDSVLVPLGNLMELDISYNRIRTLDLAKIMEHNGKLRKVYLNHNFWQCTELISMYKLIVKKSGSMDVTASDFNVPNLHGIPCSRIPIAVTSTMNFQEFLAGISQDMVLDDLYDVKLQPNLDAEEVTSSYVVSIYYMVLLCTLLFVFSYVNVALKTVCLFLAKRNMVSNNFTILYNHESDVRVA